MPQLGLDLPPANHLWMNQGGSTFVDRAEEAGVDGAWNEMGVAPGDYDGDGDVDLYVTNIFRKGRHNRLYRNDSTSGEPMFVEVAAALGVDNTGWGWGTSFIDGDRDGWVDLVATNGFRKDDFAWLGESRVETWSGILELFEIARGFYRPVVSVSFALNNWMFDLEPLGYGLSNLALIVACGIGIYVLGRRLEMPAALTFYASVIWALSPHGINMAALWISGRTSLLLTLFSVLAASRGASWCRQSRVD